MGEVYKARDPLIGRLVALKVITSGLVGRPELLERFYQEARSAGALQHPNIVTVYELGKEGDLPFIAMEFLGGESLEKLIARQDAVPLPAKVTYVVQICRALEYAHKHGVVHRDIKPGNIMVTPEGGVKVVDFGIARLVDASKTQTGTLIGTLGYMSPQQLRGEHADERSDIWAVGVMFYELLAYQRPFSGENPAALMMSIISQEPAPLKDVAAEFTADVEAIVVRMLQKDAANRYQSMEDALLDLDPVLRKLQQARVDHLVTEGKRLADAGDLKTAQQYLREALHTDTARQDAKTLLEQVSRELRRQEVQPRVQEQMAKAQNLLDAGQWQQARSEAQAALQLDSTCAPARDLMTAAEKAIERAKEIEKRLRVTKQRVAAGSLTEADKQIDDVLSLDPHNRQAQELRNQIREEISRREKRKQQAGTLQKARDLWSRLKYDECIALLTELQKEAPDDPEVAKLQATARRDQAEQRKQQKLTAARNLLAANRYDDARKLLDELLGEFSGDPAAQNLLTLLVDEEGAQAKRQRLEKGLGTLRALVGQGKHAEALQRGEELLAEFPGEFEVSEVVNFARAEVRRSEQARGLEERIANARGLVGKGSFAEAIRLMDLALADAPGNAALTALREDAAKKLKEKDRREELDKRIREVRARINRDELTGAIEMAQQTIASLGPDTDVEQLLKSAEVERTTREKKKQQEAKVVAAESLLKAGKPEEATLLLNQAIATQIVDAADPRVRAVLDEVEKRKKQAAEPARQAGGGEWPAKTPGEPAKDYVYQAPSAPMAGPGVATPDAETQEVPVATNYSATSIASPSTGPAPSQPKPPVAPARPTSKKEAKAKKGQRAMAPPSPTPAVTPAAPAPAAKAPATERPSPAATPAPTTAAPAAAKKPFPMAIVAVAAAVVIAVGLYFVLGSRKGSAPATTTNTATSTSGSAPASASKSTSANGATSAVPAPPPASTPPAQPAVNPLQQQQQELIDQAQKLMASGDFAGAQQKVSDGLKLNGPLTDDLQKLQTQIQSAQSDKASAAAVQKENQLWTAGMTAFGKDNFTAAERDLREVARMSNATHKGDAENYLNTLIPQAKANQQQLRSLISQYRTASRDGDEEKLQDLQGQFRKLESASGSVSEQAKDFAENRIATDLSNLDAAAASASTPAQPNKPAAVAPTTTISAGKKLLWVVTVDSSAARQAWNGNVRSGQMVDETHLDSGLQVENHPLPSELVAQLAANGGNHFTLEFSVDQTGRVTGGKLLSGNPTLGQTLLSRAESNWRFSAPRAHNTPVQTIVKVMVQF